jgi:uncharacterized protein
MDRFPLRSLRLRPGEELRTPVAVAIEPFTLGGQMYAVTPERVPTHLVVQRTTGGTVFALRFSATVEGPCMRCLEGATVDVSVEATEYQDDGPGASDDLASEYVVEDHLEVAVWARDAFALSLPDPILCRPACAGLCPQCGRNLNTDPHTHEDDVVDPRWAALEALRDEG